MAWLVDEVAFEDMQDTINTRQTEGYILRFTFPRFGLIEQASSPVILVLEGNGNGGVMNPLGIPGLIYTQFTLEYTRDAGVQKHAILQMNAHIAERLRDDSGGIRRFVNVYVDDEDVRFLDGLGTAIARDARVSIIPAVAGGA
jgi:sulfur-carrier protein